MHLFGMDKEAIVKSLRQEKLGTVLYYIAKAKFT